MAAEKKNKGGRPVKRTPEQVAQAVEELIADYIENGAMPTDYKLMEKLGVKVKTMQRWYDGFYDSDEDEEPTGIT